jgi:hypothetical protein
MSLKEVARELVRTVDRLAALCASYILTASAEAREAGRDNVAGGMSSAQLRRVLQAHVLARLSPRPIFGQPDPPLAINGSPEARRFAAAHPLLGL